MVRLLQNDVIISPEAAEIIASKAYDQEGLGKLAALLPEDDAELHRWLETSGEAMDEGSFRMLFSAAALGGRKLQVSLLVPAMRLREAAWHVAWTAWRMEGDVAGELLRGLETVTYLQGEGRALALFVAVAWWQKHRQGQALPGQIMRLANEFAKEKKPDLRAAIVLHNLAILLGADTLAREWARVKKSLSPATQRKQLEKMFALLDGPYEKFLYEKKTHQYTGARPVRRAVEKIGANVRCPCGSGKKYKKCCQKKDRERLRHSSSVPGLTKEEVAPGAGGVLTAARLEAMGTEIVHLDPAQVPTELQKHFIIALMVVKQYEAAIAAFREYGVPEHLRDTWSIMFEYVAGSWRPDIARQLMDVFPDAEEELDRKPNAGIRVLLVGDDPAKFLETMESELRGLLESGDAEEFQRLMWAVIESPYRALGIILARSVLPLADEKFVPGLFDGILAARAKLNLPPEDEFSEWMDEQALRKSRKHETAAGQEAQDELLAKMEELRRTKEKLAQVDRELALRVRKERREVESTPAPTADEEAARAHAKSRADKKRLNAEISQINEERRVLRKKLAEVERENEALKAEASASELKESDDEDFEVEGHQPVRLLQFPEEFKETLASYPRHVGRAVMNRLGRIASGEPAAFERVKQLKAYPDVLRARVADKYRLLFCLTPDHVRVVDLIRRADLDRRIDRLQTSGLPPVR